MLPGVGFSPEKLAQGSKTVSMLCDWVAIVPGAFGMVL